jgi:hypothetical protein
MRFLYQCKNDNIKVVLISKHELDLEESLNKYWISRNLFDEIIAISPEDDKYKYIKPENSIFIDNYFFDRKNISEKLGIPVFDVDAVECLLK